jgi:hypothetical protein
MISDQLRVLLENQVKSYFLNSELKSASITSEDATVFFYNRLSLILLGGADFRMLIKIHSNESDIAVMAKEALGEGGDIAAVDFVKELANVLGGSVKRAMESAELQVGLSLPLSIRGFDELFSEKTDGNLSGFYKIGAGSQDFVIQVQVELLSPEAKAQFEKIQFTSGDESSGALEFL